VYFVAHLDGVASDKEERYPGADDNASGVIAVLELARIIGEYAAERTLVFFFSTGEEQGSLGVNSYLDQLSQEDVRSIQYVVNIDMIGYDADQDRVMQIFHGNRPEAKVLSETMKDIMSDYRIALTPVLVKGCP
jgi:Zn-dependent M28 family amino/carboxypeptidase